MLLHNLKNITNRISVLKTRITTKFIYFTLQDQLGIEFVWSNARYKWKTNKLIILYCNTELLDHVQFWSYQKKKKEKKIILNSENGF